MAVFTIAKSGSRIAAAVLSASYRDHAEQALSGGWQFFDGTPLRNPDDSDIISKRGGFISKEYKDELSVLFAKKPAKAKEGK